MGSPDRQVNSKQRPKVTPQKDDEDDEDMDKNNDEVLHSSDTEMDEINRKKCQADNDPVIELAGADDDEETEVENSGDENKPEEDDQINQDLSNLSDDAQHKSAESSTSDDDDEDDDEIEEVSAKDQTKLGRQTRFAQTSPSPQKNQNSPSNSPSNPSSPPPGKPPPKQPSTPKQQEKAIC